MSINIKLTRLLYSCLIYVIIRVGGRLIFDDESLPATTAVIIGEGNSICSHFNSGILLLLMQKELKGYRLSVAGWTASVT